MKNWSTKKKVLVIAGVFILFSAMASGSSTDTQNNQPSSGTENTTQTAKNDKPEKQEEKFAFDNGKHEVGKDIQPGTYRTKSTDGSNFGCYWARLSGFSGEFDEIITNNGSFDKGSQVVTIKATDKGFETNGCGKWYSELTQVTSSKTEFGPGTMIVGTDIEPGTYKNSGADDEYSCYWARLSGFSGDFKEIIANENSQNTLVTIASSDKGFTSTGCGTWKKQ